MSNFFRAAISTSIFLLSMLTTSNGMAAIDATSQSASPSYWKNMISTLPHDEIPEAVFKDRDLGSSEASILFKKAVQFFHNKEYSKAIKQLEEIVSRFPKDDTAPYAHFYLGDCYSRIAAEKGEDALQESINQYLDAVRTHPSSDEAPRGLYQAGKGLFARRFYYEANAQFERIATQYPKSEYVHKGLLAKGIIYFYLKKYSVAESALRKIVDSDRSSDEDRKSGRLWLANTLHMAGRFAEAKELYKTLETKSSDGIKNNLFSFLMMGENLMNLGEYGNGRVIFQQFSDLPTDSPALPAVKLRTADALRLEGRKKEALALYSKVVFSYPAEETALIGKARAAEGEIENGKVAPAEKLLQELLSSKGEVAREAALIIADAFKKSGFSSNAAKAYRAIANQGAKSSQLQGNLVESLRDAVAALYGKKDYLSILKLYHEELRLLKAVSDPQFLRIIAYSYLEVGLPSEAASVYDRLFSSNQKLKPLSGQVLEETLFYACESYLRAGRKGDAEKAINRLLAEFPGTRFKEGINRMKGEVKGTVAQDGTPKGYLTTATAYLGEKRYKEAAEYYGKIIRLKDPLFLASAYIGLGDSYFGMGKYKEAVNAYDTGKAGGGEKGSWAGYRIGESYLNLGDVEKAQESFKSVVTNDKGVYGKMAAEELKLLKEKVK